jgi:hypothetical protein
MPSLVAFASLPFGLRGGVYPVRLTTGVVELHISALSFTPYLSVTSRPELAQSIPPRGEGEGFTSYTWYDHPFVLRVVFGRNMAALGSINSCATIARALPAEFDLDDAPGLAALQTSFAEQALDALNNLIAVVRHQAHLYHVSDLRREDIDITVRDETGALLRDDPLQDDLLRQEQEAFETFDLLRENDTWYADLNKALRKPEPLSLADDLLTEAERALTQRLPRQAIATCHTTLEAAASALLTQGMHKRGLGNQEIDHLLSTNSLTSKLEALLRRYTGFSLKLHNPGLWRDFNALNDLRNDTVHRGQRPTDDDAAFAIGVTRDLLEWLALVRARNR